MRLNRKVQVNIPTWLLEYMQKEKDKQGVLFSDLLRYFIYRGVVEYVADVDSVFKNELHDKIPGMVDKRVISDLGYEARRGVHRTGL